MLHPGLYEQVINNALNRELSEAPEACKSTPSSSTAEASKALSAPAKTLAQRSRTANRYGERLYE